MVQLEEEYGKTRQALVSIPVRIASMAAMVRHEEEYTAERDRPWFQYLFGWLRWLRWSDMKRNIRQNETGLGFSTCSDGFDGCDGPT